MSVKDLCFIHPIMRAGVLGVLCAGLFSTAVVAQPGRDGGMSPEEQAKVHERQAKSVAADLKLDEEKTGSLLAAYAAHQKAAVANRGGGGGRGDWEAMRKQQEEQQAKLATELKGFLDEGQAKDAAALLAGLNRGWDRMVQVVMGFGLEEAKETEAQGHILAYVKAGAKAREGARGPDNMAALRTEMEAAKKTLDANLAPLLSDGQKTEWAAATERAPRGGGDRPPRGGDGGGDRGDRGNRPNSDS